MGTLCTTCQGSGRLQMGSFERSLAAVSACAQCDGRGYRHDHRALIHEADRIEVAKVLAFDPHVGAVRIYLEESLHAGDRLLAICHGILHSFEVGTMWAAGMNLSLALKGWEVSLIVPQPMPPGTWILREE